MFSYPMSSNSRLRGSTWIYAGYWTDADTRRPISGFLAQKWAWESATISKPSRLGRLCPFPPHPHLSPTTQVALPPTSSNSVCQELARNTFLALMLNAGVGVFYGNFDNTQNQLCTWSAGAKLPINKCMSKIGSTEFCSPSENTKFSHPEGEF